MHTRIAGGCLYHASVALGKPINPNFPQDKVLDTLIELIVTNPYSPEYYEFAISRFGQSEDITKIKEYFGLTE